VDDADWLEKSTKYQQEIENINKIFERYKDHKAQTEEQYDVQIRKLHDVIRKNRIELAFLNDRLLFTEYKLNGRTSEISGKGKVITKLKNSLFELEKELAAFQGKNIEKDGKQADPRIAQMAHEEETKKERLLKTKEKQIKKLKLELAAVRKQMKEMGDNDQKLAALKENLINIKLQLRQQEITFNKNDYDTRFLEAQIKEIEEQLDIVEGLMNGTQDGDGLNDKKELQNIS